MASLDGLPRVCAPDLPGAGAALLAFLLLGGCAGAEVRGAHFVSERYGFRVSLPPAQWVAQGEGEEPIGLLEDGALLVHWRNPHTGGHLLVRAFSSPFWRRTPPLEARVARLYRTFLRARGNNMRIVRDGAHPPGLKGVKYSSWKGFERAEFSLRGTRARFRGPEEVARRMADLQGVLPFGPQPPEELLKRERELQEELQKPLFEAPARAKVVLLKRGRRFLEFYYFDHPRAYPSGVRVFDRLLDSLEHLPR